MSFTPEPSEMAEALFVSHESRYGAAYELAQDIANELSMLSQALHSSSEAGSRVAWSLERRAELLVRLLDTSKEAGRS